MSRLGAKALAARPTTTCACGCGREMPAVDKWNRPRRYIRGHHVQAIKTRGRKSLKVYMTLAEARGIAGTLSQTTKMPGWSYGLDAFACDVGSKLAAEPHSTCADCYARKNFYMLDHVRRSQEFRTLAITHPRWVEAMTELILHHCKDDPWFRWHDSGDLMSLDHLERIAEVCWRTPRVRHWLPTREYDLVAEFLAAGAEVPPNLTIRLSAFWVGLPAYPSPESLEALPTSTVHLERGRPVELERRRDSIECLAYTRGPQGGSCGSCRACWSPKVRNVSYPRH